MQIPFSYSLRNLWTRRLTTALTVGGMALVVFVFATVLMLEEGLRRTLVDTGSADNVVLTRRAAQTEVQSGVDRVQAGVIEVQPEVARGAGGVRLASKETVVLVNLRKRGTDNKPSNVIVRGVEPAGLLLRPQVRVVQGRAFQPGASEIMVGKNISERFQGAVPGESIYFGLRHWIVVGVFDAGSSGFDSEIWGDVDQLMQAFRRQAYSSVIVRLTAPDALDALVARLGADPRLTVDAKREVQFYADQSAVLANFIRYLGLTLSIIFSVGAIIGAMITMYASVANRVGEIGTLRALGFRRGSILAAFLLESVLLGATGGLIGLLAASFMQLITISTMNWQSFSELAFGFALTPAIGLKSVVFAMAMGLIGGFLPSIRAARMEIVDALRAA